MLLGGVTGASLVTCLGVPKVLLGGDQWCGKGGQAKVCCPLKMVPGSLQARGSGVGTRGVNPDGRAQTSCKVCTKVDGWAGASQRMRALRACCLSINILTAKGHWSATEG
jgi:hypothetical protein